MHCYISSAHKRQCSAIRLHCMRVVMAPFYSKSISSTSLRQKKMRLGLSALTTFCLRRCWAGGARDAAGQSWPEKQQPAALPWHGMVTRSWSTAEYALQQSAVAAMGCRSGCTGTSCLHRCWNHMGHGNSAGTSWPEQPQTRWLLYCHGTGWWRVGVDGWGLGGML